MNAFILFKEGLSGHYLKSILNGEETPGKFRMDPWWPGMGATKPPFDWSPVQCGHVSPNHPVDLVLVILVRQRLYQAIYNVFYKKFLVEQCTPEEYANWQSNLPLWYDRAFYNIRDYYQIFRQNTEQNQNPNIVEFDRLLDPEYVESVSLKYFDRPLTEAARRLITEYASHQLDIELTIDGSSMEEIVAPIPDARFQQSPWFASYAIFKFETNNGLTESQRKWSIDAVTQVIDRQYLLNLSQQYN